MSQTPPDTIEPSELFLLLSSEARPHRIVDLPRKKADGSPIAQVAMVALTQEEHIAASATSERRTQDLLRNAIPKKDEAARGYTDVYNNIAVCEILFRACKKADEPTKNAFRTPHEIQKLFTNDELGVMHHHYLTVCHEIGPIVATMTDEEVETWVRVLVEGASAVPLDCLSWDALTTLVTTMASRLHAYQTDNSSAGSPSGLPVAEMTSEVSPAS